MNLLSVFNSQQRINCFSVHFTGFHFISFQTCKYKAIHISNNNQFNSYKMTESTNTEYVFVPWNYGKDFKNCKIKFYQKVTQTFYSNTVDFFRAFSPNLHLIRPLRDLRYVYKTGVNNCLPSHAEVSINCRDALEWKICRIFLNLMLLVWSKMILIINIQLSIEIFYTIETRINKWEIGFLNLFCSSWVTWGWEIYAKFSLLPGAGLNTEPRNADSAHRQEGDDNNVYGRINYNGSFD